MSYQLTALAVLFFIAEVTSQENCTRLSCLKRNRKCNIIEEGVTNDEKDLILELHNREREFIATGKQEQLPESPGMPTASNMMEMVWDDELAELAQKRAETCNNTYDCYECLKVDRFPVGQNLFRMWYSLKATSEPENVWQKMIGQFRNEILDFKRKYISSFKLRSIYSDFSQIMWAETWKVGCGKVVHTDDKFKKTHVACHYGPRGNLEKRQMYKIGEPCSACPDLTCCGEDCGETYKYEGLCQAKDGFDSAVLESSHEEVEAPETAKDSKVLMCRVPSTGRSIAETRTSANSIECRLSTPEEWPLSDSIPGTGGYAYMKCRLSSELGAHYSNPALNKRMHYLQCRSSRF